MGKNNKRKTTKQFKDEIFNLVGNEYDVLGEYVNSHTLIKMKHIKCGNILDINPMHFLHSGTRCRHCSYKASGIRRRHTTEDVREKIRDVSDNKYELMSEYRTSNEKIRIKHIECGHVFEMKYRFFVNMGQRCPKCRISKGEEKIKNWLKTNNLKFKQEKRFSDCKSERPLPFDFQVFMKDKFVLIEYDGEQHFEERFSFSNKKDKDSLLNIQKRDNIKNVFCENNNIALLRISYYEYDDVEKILDNYFISSTTIESTSKDGSE